MTNGKPHANSKNNTILKTKATIIMKVARHFSQFQLHGPRKTSMKAKGHHLKQLQALTTTINNEH